jgi:hypothetical protein
MRSQRAAGHAERHEKSRELTIFLDSDTSGSVREPIEGFPASSSLVQRAARPDWLRRRRET